MSNLKLLKHANDNMPLSREEKNNMIELAAEAYGKYLDALRFDWRNDPNSADTPHRVARAFVNELSCGCYDKPPKITSFDNVDGYDGMVCQNNIKVVSMCSHHREPFTGFAHVAYLPSKNGKVIGLSKINRVVDWFARRGQVQENLTAQVHHYIDKICENNKGVAVMIECEHQCCSNRGIKHDSTMRTARMTGSFLNNNDNSREEFYKFVEFSKK